MTIKYTLSFLIAFITSALLIPVIKKISFCIQSKGQPIYEDCPQRHKKKEGTATLGGLAILISTVITSAIMLDDYFNYHILAILVIFLGYGALGLIDDLSKLKQKKNRNSIMPAKVKFLSQLFIAFLTIYLVSQKADVNLFSLHSIKISANYSFNITYWGYLIFFLFVTVGSSNATNLTDGLDGLLLTQIIIIFLTIAFLSTKNVNNLLSIKDYDNITKICLIIAGSSLGLLWFNTNKATIFTGDVGSLSLGGLLGIISLLLQIELILPIIAIIMVSETLSVIIQVLYFKYTKKKYGEGRRVFKMTPIHHHFEELGMNESKIVMRFMICTVFSCAIAIILFLYLSQY
ncbi:phospho-N-acetylmuramoyl-pentapeptide-transferase [Anaplasmataceae bacterium AB001_6]|nr:phospho-N-acetylmuramoyl-pentapeptide-transferase [Anaplasmataceae bacterium AB001_6]